MLVGTVMLVRIVMQVRTVMLVRRVMQVRRVMLVGTVMLIRIVMQVRTVMLVRRVMLVRTVMQEDGCSYGASQDSCCTPDDSTEPTYFMPCILKSATCAELQGVRSSPDIAPLMIRYECGYMPLGIFSSLIIGLVSQDENGWELVEKGLCRNKIEFQVGDDVDSVTLISRPTFMEVVVLRESDPMKPTKSVCSDIRSTLESTLKDIHSYMKYSSSARFQYGFECPTHPGKEHLCVLKSLTSNRLLCSQNPKKCTVLPMKDMFQTYSVV